MVPYLNARKKAGFTLIELSIVLVIIGLIVGGVLVGRDLISAAAIRSQIAQIDKYQQAVNTFRGKYGALPGDMSGVDSARFGFLARGPHPGQGDGNGVIVGNWDGSAGGICADSGIESCATEGEQGTFWVDLSMANLIDGGFRTATPTAVVGFVPGTGVSLYLPSGKLGGNSYVFVWSGGWKIWILGGSDQVNYYGLTGATGIGSYGEPNYTSVLTVMQAYNIDKKIDDGLPQLGSVIAFAPTPGWAAAYSTSAGWLSGGFDGGDFEETNPAGALGPVTSVSDIGNHTAAGPYSCYDGASGLPERYSITQTSGRGLNCWLSFRFQ